MRLRSHTQEALSQEFPRNSSDNLGFLHPKEHEGSLAWSCQLFSRIQIGLVPNQFGRVPCGFLTLDTWARQSLPVVIVSLATSGAVARVSAMMSDIGIRDKLLVNYSSTEFGWAKWISTKLTEVAAWNAVFEATYSIIWNGSICEESRQAQECSTVVGNSCRSTSSRSCRANDLALRERSLRWNVR